MCHRKGCRCQRTVLVCRSALGSKIGHVACESRLVAPTPENLREKQHRTGCISVLVPNADWLDDIAAALQAQMTNVLKSIVLEKFAEPGMAQQRLAQVQVKA